MCVALVAAVPAVADPSVGAKQAQAQQVMARVQQLGANLETVIAQYQYANVQLHQIQHEQHVNRRELVIARTNLKTSEKIISQRLVSLYQSEPASTLEIVLGAQNLDAVMNRLESEKSVASQDASVIDEVRSSKTAIVRNEHQLARANAAQQRIVAVRAEKKREIEGSIAEQQRLLSTIRGQIAQIEAAQRARQLALERAATERLQQEQAAQAQQEASTIVGASASTPGLSGIVAPPSRYEGVVGIAMQEIGQPYVWGGAAPGGFDCSGLVMWAYAQMGVSLPHSSYAMWDYGVPVSRDDLEPGDILFFDDLGHVGLYIGNDEFVEAPHTGAYVQISSLDESWYAANYVGARRILST